MDILINNVNIPDSTKKKFFEGSIAVVKNKITDLCSDSSIFPSERFDKVIDGKGSYVLPGFFDVHSRADLAMISEPSRLCAVSQGVVTELLGCDGFGVAPITHKNYLTHIQNVEHSLGNPQLKWTWEKLTQYLEQLHTKNATNIISYVPHGTIRIETSALKIISMILERSLDEGASGLSISCSRGLSKEAWKNDEEMNLVLSILKKKQAILSVSLLGSPHPNNDLERAINLAKTHGVKLHISRLFCNSDRKASDIVQLIERAKKDIPGFLVDISPYSTRLLKLSSLLPSWVRDLSSEELRVKLKKPEAIQKLFDALNFKEDYLERLRLVLTPKKDFKKHEGYLLEHIAMERDESIYEVLLQLVLFDLDKTFFEYEAVNPEILKEVFELPFVIPAGSGFLEGRSLPDTFGFIPKYIKKLSDKDPFKIAQKLSYTPAEFYGLKWGIKKGLKANFVITNPDNIISEADYYKPKVLSEGVDYVFVAGELALDKNRSTGTRSGEVLTWS